MCAPFISQAGDSVWDIFTDTAQELNGANGKILQYKVFLAVWHLPDCTRKEKHALNLKATIT